MQQKYAKAWAEYERLKTTAFRKPCGIRPRTRHENQARNAIAPATPMNPVLYVATSSPVLESAPPPPPPAPRPSAAVISSAGKARKIRNAVFQRCCGADGSIARSTG